MVLTKARNHSGICRIEAQHTFSLDDDQLERLRTVHRLSGGYPVTLRRVGREYQGTAEVDSYSGRQLVAAEGEDAGAVLDALCGAVKTAKG